MENRYENERLEAINAGERALNSLRNAADTLSSAKNWGIADLLGGGFITTHVKRSKMDKAQYYMNQAKNDLQAFSKEFNDIATAVDLNIQTGDFLTFADYFFDGFISDWLVQDKINQAAGQVAEAIRRTESILKQLRSI